MFVFLNAKQKATFVLHNYLQKGSVSPFRVSALGLLLRAQKVMALSEEELQCFLVVSDTRLRCFDGLSAGDNSLGVASEGMQPFFVLLAGQLTPLQN